MTSQNRRDPTKSRKDRKFASVETVAKTSKKDSTELTDEQLERASGGQDAASGMATGKRQHVPVTG